MEGIVSNNRCSVPGDVEERRLRERIRQLEEENATLRAVQLLNGNAEQNTTDDDGGESDDDDIIIDQQRKQGDQTSSGQYTLPVHDGLPHPNFTGVLNPDQIERYSRQLLVRGGFGVDGQARLLNSSVLVVGAGGIGSTACGVGKLTIVDFDEVDMSNLHRQIIHRESDVGLNKAKSAQRAANNLNPTIACDIVREPLTSSNALRLISAHDCVVDASDNPQTRYLINDACVLSVTPLVSGSAMGVEGQLTVYNYNGGPCYRCLYPRPNVAEGSKTCSDSGVLGPVPGLIGILQAVEVIKVITGVGDVLFDRLLMYDALQCTFLRIKKPPKQRNCSVCGTDATITSMKDSYEASESARGPSCSGVDKPPELEASRALNCVDYDRLRHSGEPHVLLDVRVKEQYDLCSLPGAINIPLASIPQRLEEISKLSNGTMPVYCICRRGVASVMATKLIIDSLEKFPSIHSVKNVTGGFDAWRLQVDGSFPTY